MPTSKIYISFGLVTISVAVHSATRPGVSFVRLHKADSGRVRNQVTCSLDGAQLSPPDVGRAYRTDRGLVPLTEQDLAALPLPSARTFSILAFVAGDAIDPLMIGRAHYLSPDGPHAVKPYVLLRDAMERRQRVGLGKVALHGGRRGRESLAMIRPLGKVLVMDELLWRHQIRPLKGVVPDRQVTVDQEELAAAEELMDSYGSLSETDVHDRFAEDLQELAAAKIAAREPHFGGVLQTPPTGPVMDLMAALQDSVRSAKAARGEIDDDPARLMPSVPAKGTRLAAKKRKPSGEG